MQRCLILLFAASACAQTITRENPQLFFDPVKPPYAPVPCRDTRESAFVRSLPPWDTDSQPVWFPLGYWTRKGYERMRDDLAKHDDPASKCYVSGISDMLRNGDKW